MKAIKWAADQLGDLAGIRVLSDTMGACVLVDIDTSIYGQTSVMKTAYWYTDTHYVFIAHGDERSQLRVELRGKSESSSEELDILSREFCNRLLDCPSSYKLEHLAA